MSAASALIIGPHTNIICEGDQQCLLVLNGSLKYCSQQQECYTKCGLRRLTCAFATVAQLSSCSNTIIWCSMRPHACGSTHFSQLSVLQRGYTSVNGSGKSPILTWHGSSLGTEDTDLHIRNRSAEGCLPPSPHVLPPSAMSHSHDY